MEFEFTNEGPLPLKFGMKLNGICEILGNPKKKAVYDGDMEAYWFDYDLKVYLTDKDGATYYEFFSSSRFDLKRNGTTISGTRGTIRDLILPSDEVFIDDEDSFLVKPIGIVGDWNLEEVGSGSLLHCGADYLTTYDDLGYEPITFDSLSVERE